MSKYAVDLDGTLAEYHGWRGYDDVGKPIQPMMDRVKKWISEGIEVIIFTARAEDPDAIPAVIKWLEDNDLPELEITCIKSGDIERFYDDRAIQVRKNTGEILGDESIV